MGGRSGGRTPTGSAAAGTGTASTASASVTTTASSSAGAATACSPRRSTSVQTGMSPARRAAPTSGTTAATTARPMAACAANGCVRSRAVEEFLGRISFSCRNQQYGCEVFLLHHEMRAHERTCHYDPCFCPVHRCGFAGPAYDLESHLATIHRWEVINFRYGESFQAPAFESAIFRCEDYGELFHISSSREGLGTALSMICIRPDNACEEEFTYELKMPAGGRRHRLQIQSTVWNISLRYGIGEGSDVFLLVPDKLPGVENGCAVEVCIRKVVGGN